MIGPITCWDIAMAQLSVWMDAAMRFMRREFKQVVYAAVIAVIVGFMAMFFYQGLVVIQEQQPSLDGRFKGLDAISYVEVRHGAD